MIHALIPAGGKSVRMGRPKLLLPLGGRCVLEHVVAALHVAGVDHVLVVAARHLPELAAVARAAGAHVYQLTEQTPDMRATIEEGLRWIEENYHPRNDDDWLLVPADHPTLDAAVIRQLIETREAQPERTIFVPTYQGRRGHPTLIRWSLCEGIRRHPVGLGLNTYLRQHVSATQEVPVDSADVLVDLDTPEDYERLRARWHDHSA